MALLNDITFGQYYATDSFVHRLDPRTKFLCTFVFMTLLLILSQLHIVAGVFLMTILTIPAANLPVGLVLRNLRPFAWLFILTFAIQLIYGDGAALFVVPVLNLPVTRMGFMLGLLYSMRLALLIVMAAVLTLTTSPIEITDAMERLLQPLKRLGLPVHELAMVMSLALRFIPTLMEEAERIKKAQISRGASLDGNWLKRIRSMMPMILPLFISAFRRADDLAMAMDARCYHGGVGRTSYQKLMMARNDYLVLAGVMVLSAALLIIGVH